MTYLNSSGETFVEQPGAQLTIDAWGLDSITRKYSGKVANIPDFIATLRKNRNKPDSEYNALTLTNYTISKGRAWAEVDVNYKGTFDGKLPAPIIDGGGMTTQAVQLTYKDTEIEQLTTALNITYTKPSCSFTYKAASATIRYVTRNRPSAAAYAQELGGLTSRVQIISQQGALGPYDILPLQPIPQNNADPQVFIPTERAFNAITVVVNDGPRYKQEGQFFLCEESNQVTLMPFDFVFIVTPP